MWFQQCNPCVDNLPWKIGRGQTSNYGFAPRSHASFRITALITELAGNKMNLALSHLLPHFPNCFASVSALCPPRLLIVSRFVCVMPLTSLMQSLRVVSRQCEVKHADRCQLILTYFSNITNKCLWTSACHWTVQAPSQRACFFLSVSVEQLCKWFFIRLLVCRLCYVISLMIWLQY